MAPRPSLALRVDGLSGDLTVYDAGDVEMFSGDAERSVRDQSLAEFALAHGYADQAHLSREIAELTGATPAELRRRAPGSPPHLFPGG